MKFIFFIMIQWIATLENAFVLNNLVHIMLNYWVFL